MPIRLYVGRSIPNATRVLRRAIYPRYAIVDAAMLRDAGEKLSHFQEDSAPSSASVPALPASPRSNKLISRSISRPLGRRAQEYFTVQP